MPSQKGFRSAGEVSRIRLLGGLVFLILVPLGAPGQQSGSAPPGGLPPSSEPSAPPPASQRDAEGRPLVTNVFFDTDIRQALSDVAAQTGAIIIPDDTVQGQVSMDLKEVPLEKALDLLLMPGGFVYEEVEEGIYLVASPDPKSPSFRQIAHTRVVGLNYLKGDELQKILPDIYTPFVKVDQIGNQIVVTAPQRLLDKVVAQIQALDLPPLQVMIEALVVETSRSDLQDFNLKLQGTHLGLNTGQGLITYVDQADQLLHQILWLVGQDKAQIKASPRVIAQEGQEANVRVTIEQYFQIITGRLGWEYTTLEKIEAPIGLTITPRVAEKDRQVTCILEPEVGDVTGTGPNNLPIITKRTAKTTVRVQDGQVIAIGGLLQELQRQTERKIPVLGELPLVGPLFRSRQTDRQQREVIIFVVPHILDPQGRFQGPLLFQRINADGTEVSPQPALSNRGRKGVSGKIARLEIQPFPLVVGKGGEQQLSLRAWNAKGEPLPLLPSQVEWRVPPELGQIDDRQVFRASPVPRRGILRARVGEVEAQVRVTVDSTTRLIDDFEEEQPYRFSSYPPEVPGTVQRVTEPRHRGAYALQLKYDFTTLDVTRAAYAVLNRDLGRPSSVSVWAYGDGQKNWLRGRFIDANGKKVAVDFTTRVDFQGEWRQLRAVIPAGTAYPIRWESFYIAQFRPEVKTKGVIYLDEFEADYPPSPVP